MVHVYILTTCRFTVCVGRYVCSPSGLPAMKGHLRLGVFMQSLRLIVGQKSRACCIAVVVPASRSPPAGSGWPLAQVLFSAASSVHLAPHLKLSIFWPGSGLRAMRLGRPHEMG